MTQSHIEPIEPHEIIAIDERWETGTPHDVRSEHLFDFIKGYDFAYGGDFFCFKKGGDGDNGEHLMYILDEYYANKDRQEAEDAETTT